jgi:hypothetical protein
MRKLSVCVAMAAVVLFTGTAWAQKTQIEIAPKYPTFNLGNQPRQNDPWAPGTWMNPYQARDTSTGQTWTIKPKYPSFTNDDWQKPGTFHNPIVIESD